MVRGVLGSSACLGVMTLRLAAIPDCGSWLRRRRLRQAGRSWWCYGYSCKVVDFMAVAVRAAGVWWLLRVKGVAAALMGITATARCQAASATATMV